MTANFLAVIYIFVIMVFVVIFLILIGGGLIYSWVKLVNSIFIYFVKKSKNKQSKVSSIPNPYIETHLLRRRNDKDYEDYLNWLDKTGGDLPVKKVLTREEWEFQQQLNL